MADYIIGTIVFIIIIGVAYKLYKNKKNGKSNCSCGKSCEGCNIKH